MAKGVIFSFLSYTVFVKVCTIREVLQLAIPVCSCLSIKAGSCNGINLINENDGWSVLLGHPENVSHHARSLHSVVMLWDIVLH